MVQTIFYHGGLGFRKHHAVKALTLIDRNFALGIPIAIGSGTDEQSKSTTLQQITQATIFGYFFL